MFTIVHAASLGVAVALAAEVVAAQAPFTYREYSLASTVVTVVRATGARDGDVRLLHERPAAIRQLEWRVPYSATGIADDPVRTILFSFVDDQLYEIVVTYDRDRMEGLTNADVIDALSATYGKPLSTRPPPVRSLLPVSIPPNASVIAQWEDAESRLSLSRNTYSPELQLVLLSKTLHPRALAAIKEAVRLDAKEAPARERKQRASDAAAAREASDRAREANKEAFRP